jgi:TfoX/Sxy family transcriptional regulator of competence genes
MAFDEFLAERVSNKLATKGISFEEKKMMGGLCYMIDEKMCLGIIKESLMARIDPDKYGEALKKKGCKEMDFTGRAMKGFVFVDPEGIDFEEDLDYWVDLCLEFNPKAKASKKKSERKRDKH